LPELTVKSLLIGEAGLLLKGGNKSDQIAAFVYGLSQDMEMIGHDAISVHGKGVFRRAAQ